MRAEDQSVTVRAKVSSSAMVGREAELRALLTAIAEARDSSPSVTVLSGDAGVGKTRLTRELASIARTQGMVTLHGECVQLSGGEFPYAPLAAALGEVEPEALANAVDELPAVARRQLARALPGVVSDPADLEPPHDELAQPQLFGWLALLLRRLSAAAPLLLTIEDVHWADVSTRDFLLFLAHSIRIEPMAVLLTVRTDMLRREHPLRPVLGRLVAGGHARQLELAPLSRPDAERQVEAILGGEPPPELMQRLFERAEGNPFYTEELLAAGAGSDELPATLRDALLLRVESLSAPAQELMRLMAAVSRPAEHDLIEAAAGISRVALRDHLREAVDQQLLVCDRHTSHYRFRHALLREAVYGDLLPAERVDLHRTVAQALEQRRDAASAAERAHHWEIANEPGAAVLAAIDAALAAEQAYAHAEALAQFERALRLWPEGRLQLEGVALDQVGLLGRAAEVARWTGDFDRAQILCGRALDLFEHRSDPERAAELFERLGRYQPWNVEASLEAYHAALSLLPENRAAQRMRLMVDVAVALTFLGRWEDARATAEDALRVARGSEMEAEESAARAALGVSVAFMGDPAAGEEHLRAALHLAERAGSPQDLAQVHLDLGEVLRLQGRIGDALAVMLDGERLAQRLGATGSYGNFIAVNACDDLLRLGRWEEADERLRALSRLPTLAPTIELLMCSVAGRLLTARGEFDEATMRFERALVLCQDVNPMEFIPALHAGYAELELWRGRTEQARERAAAGLRVVQRGEDALHTPALYSMGARAEAERAERARALGDVPEAERAHRTAQELCDRLQALLEAPGRTVRPPEAEAHLASCRAELFRAGGSAAPERWAEAAAQWRARKSPYAVAYALYRQSEALLATRGGRPAAQQVLAEAQRLCAALAARPLADEVRALARRARLKLDEAQECARDAPDKAADSPAAEFGLTPREAEVLVLLGAGLTNREISGRLFISQHTAGVHVSHILAKLGVSNRVMAAATAQRLGLVSPD